MRPSSCFVLCSAVCSVIPSRSARRMCAYSNGEVLAIIMSLAWLSDAKRAKQNQQLFGHWFIYFFNARSFFIRAITLLDTRMYFWNEQNLWEPQYSHGFSYVTYSNVWHLYTYACVCVCCLCEFVHRKPSSRTNTIWWLGEFSRTSSRGASKLTYLNIPAGRVCSSMVQRMNFEYGLQ